MAMHVGRIIRGYANKTTLPTKTLCPVAARSYFSGAGEPESVFSLGEKLCALALFSCVGLWFDWGKCRSRKEAWITYELREMFKSAEAELNIVEREIDAIKAKRHARGNKDKVCNKV